MTYDAVSDTQPVTAYGGGSMWVYDVATTNGPEVVQIAEATGEVTDTVRLPTLYRPLLAANDDGLWLGNSVQGGSSSSPLWHVAPGATAAVAVAGPPATQVADKAGVGPRTFDLDVMWLVGSGDRLWAGIALAGNIDQTIWGFEGPAAEVVFHVSEGGYDPTEVVGDEGDGLWTAVSYPPLVGRIERTASGAWISPGQNRRQDIVRIDPDTGRETVEGAIRPAPTLSAEIGTVAGESTSLDGSFYILQSSAGGDGRGTETLVRLRP
jgi:hypothetical protein